MSIPYEMVMTDRSRNIRLIHYVLSLAILQSLSNQSIPHGQTSTIALKMTKQKVFCTLVALMDMLSDKMMYLYPQLPY